MSDSTIHHPHDKLFRASLQNPQVARDFLAFYLPQSIKAALDFKQIELCASSFISEQLREYESDVLFKVRLAGKESYLFILVEHQSAVDELMPLRLFNYMLAVWKQHCSQQGKGKALPLPIVFPMVFFTNETPYAGMRTLWELCGPEAKLMRKILQSPFYLVKVNSLADKKLLANATAGTLGFVLRKKFQKNTLSQVQLLSANLKKIGLEIDRKLLLQLTYYIVHLNKNDEVGINKILAVLKQTLDEELEKKIMTYADELIEQGRVAGEMAGMLRGRAEGKAEGKAEGELIGERKGKIATALEMLKEGFPPNTIAKITKLPLWKIEELATNEEIS